MGFLERIFGRRTEATVPTASAALSKPPRPAFTREFFMQGVGAAAMRAKGSGGTISTDAFSLAFREALEEILAEHLNAGRWNSLQFSKWGTKPDLPGRMIYSLEMAERPDSGGLHDAYVVFYGGGPLVIIFVGVPKNRRMTVTKAKERIIEALRPDYSPQVKRI